VFVGCVVTSTRYKVTVFTGDERGGGTGNNVFISLFGDDDLQCGEIQLSNDPGLDFLTGG